MYLEPDLLARLACAQDALSGDDVTLDEAEIPIGAVRLRRGLWWRKVSAVKWKPTDVRKTPGIQVGKHTPHMPLKHRWEKRQGL